MSGKSFPFGSVVFVFIDGVTHETFTKDEEFRSGTVGVEIANKVRIAWDAPQEGDMTNKSGIAYEYVEKSRLTKIAHKTYVLDEKTE